MRLKPVLAAISIALLLGAIGCTRTESPREVDASGTTVDQSSDMTAEVDWSEERASTTSTTELASGGDCPTQAEVDELNDSFDDLDLLTGDGFAQQILSALDIIDRYLPSEYDDDMDLLRQTYGAFSRALDGVDLTDPLSITPEQEAQIENAGEALEAPEVVAAQDRVDQYFETNCPDIDFD